MQCRQCQATISDEVRFCPNCGAEPAAEPKPLRPGECPSCHRMNSPFRVTCKDCGTTLPKASMGRPKLGVGRVLLIGLGVLLLLGAISSLTRQGSTTESEPTVVAAAAATATATAVPTPTRPPATPTPEPTSTPESTPTPEPTPTPEIPAEVREYANFVADVSDGITSGLRQITDTAREAGQRPSLIFDNAWRIRTAAGIAALRVSADQIRNYGPVHPDVEDIHTLMLSIADDLQYVADEYAAGIDQVAVQRINNAVSRMNAMNSKAREVTRKVNELAAKYGM